MIYPNEEGPIWLSREQEFIFTVGDLNFLVITLIQPFVQNFLRQTKWAVWFHWMAVILQYKQAQVGT